MKKLLIIAVFNLFVSVSLYSQGDLNEQPKVFFRNERSFAVLLNTDGFGVSYRGAKRIDYLNKSLLEIEAGILKHPKEYKLSNPYYQGGTSFVFGKLNSPFYLRGGIGHQHELYKKADLGGIAIRYFYLAGPVLSIYKPIYYKVLYPTSTGPEVKVEKYNVSIAMAHEIFSRASFTKGLAETRVLPGLFAKGGFNFEYSKEDKIIHAVEVGAQVNAFPKKIPIMASSDNKIIFFSLFVSYRFGMIIDPLNPESNKLSNMFRRKKSY